MAAFFDVPELEVLIAAGHLSMEDFQNFGTAGSRIEPTDTLPPLNAKGSIQDLISDASNKLRRDPDLQDIVAAYLGSRSLEDRQQMRAVVLAVAGIQTDQVTTK